MCLTAQVVLAAFSGSVVDRKNKYSLRNLSNHKHYSLSLNHPTKKTWLYGGYAELPSNNFSSSNQVQSMMRMEKGNTSFVFAYKFKVKVPRFKTPTKAN